MAVRGALKTSPENPPKFFASPLDCMGWGKQWDADWALHAYYTLCVLILVSAYARSKTIFNASSIFAMISSSSSPRTLTNPHAPVEHNEI